MKAQVCRNFGSIENLNYLDTPDPTPKNDEILIKVRAIGVNFADSLLVQGKYQASPPLPFVPGTEASGEIIALGTDCKKYKVGDRVYGYNQAFGAFAEKVVFKEKIVSRLPENLSFDEGAALLAATGTAHHALRQKANLKENETLVVLGAAGGTGSAAVQIGKAIGARVIAACSSDSKLDFAKSLGVDECINYSKEDLRTSIKNLTNGKGADVIYDTIGGDAFDASTRAITWNGRLLVVGFASGRIPQFPVNLALVKGFSIVGVFWGTFIEAEPELYENNRIELQQWLANDIVKPKVNQRFHLENCVDALKYISNRKVLGKVVLNP